MRSLSTHHYLIAGLTFILVSCGGGGGGGSKAATVSITSSLSEVLVGQTASLTWSSDQNSCTASGAWSGSKSSGGTETVTIGAAGNNSFSIACGNGSSSVSVLGYRNSEGVVADGYLSDATVFIDANDNKVADDSETSVTTDNEGKFSFRYANGHLISLGGKDVDTQTLLEGLLLAAPNDGYIDGPVITPLTTLALIMEAPENLNVALGLDTSINILNTDPVAKLSDGGIYNVLYERGNQITILALALKNIHDSGNTAKENTVDFFTSIATKLEELYTASPGQIDIEGPVFLGAVIDQVALDTGITISDTVKANTLSALSSIMPLIQVKSEASVTTALINFGLNTLQNDISAISLGEDLSSLSKYGDVKAYIAATESVSANDLLPVMASFNDSASTEEDTAVTIGVLNNDSLIPGTATITISSAPSKGSVSINGLNVTYTPSADVNGDDSFSYTVTVGSETATATVSISISPVNDAPSINSQTVVRGTTGSTAVTGLNITDVDGDDITITLSGTDAESFELIDNVLTFKAAPDYFVKSSYSLTIVATDGTLETTQDITVSVYRLQTTGFEIPDAIKVIETL
jgi:hypothetical protein